MSRARRQAAANRQHKRSAADPRLLAQRACTLAAGALSGRAAALFSPAQAPARAVELYDSGVKLRNEGQLVEAEQAFRKSLAVFECADSWVGLGSALVRQEGKEAEGYSCCERALALDPHHLHANRALGGRHFEQGQWNEAKRYVLAITPQQSFPYPRWQGEPLDGKTLMIHNAGEGHGDTLQHIRHLELLGDMARALIVVVPSRLLCVIKRCKLSGHSDNYLLHDLALATGSPALTAARNGLSLPAIDCWTPTHCLPYLCNTTLETIPVVPYLSPEPALVERWKRELPAVGGGIRVGICWQGDRKLEHDRERSVPLQLFAPLAAIPGVQLVSLQVGYGAEQLEQVSFPVIDWGSRFNPNSFADAAAAVAVLDLVISIDSAIAHLAGALARPVWLLNRFHGDARWFRDRDDSPWYPTMRIFRQSQPGDWNGVFQRVQEVLTAVTAV